MERIQDILVKPDVSIKRALRQMDDSGKRFLFIADNDNTILGVVSDGDIRRWILDSKNLDENIANVMNTNPVVLHERFLKEQAKEIMLSKRVECIPIIDENRKLISAVWWLDLFDKEFDKPQQIDIPVVIMAGGEGSRLAPFTNILPKPLMPIGEKPIIQLIIDKFIKFGCKDFYLSINNKANILKAYFNDCKHDYNLSYIQEEKPLGTIGSLYLLENRLKKAFFVSNCDILIEADYSDTFNFHKESKNVITSVVSLKHYTIPYGICEIENGGALKAIKEKPEYDFLVNTGLCIMEPEVFEILPKDTFYTMTELINDCINKKKQIGIYPVSEKSWLDMGQLQELHNMLQRFGVKE